MAQKNRVMTRRIADSPKMWGTNEPTQRRSTRSWKRVIRIVSIDCNTCGQPSRILPVRRSMPTRTGASRIRPRRRSGHRSSTCARLFIPRRLRPRLLRRLLLRRLAPAGGLGGLGGGALLSPQGRAELRLARALADRPLIQPVFGLRRGQKHHAILIAHFDRPAANFFDPGDPNIKFAQRLNHDDLLSVVIGNRVVAQPRRAGENDALAGDGDPLPANPELRALGVGGETGLADLTGDAAGLVKTELHARGGGGHQTALRVFLAFFAQVNLVAVALLRGVQFAELIGLRLRALVFGLVGRFELVVWRVGRHRRGLVHLTVDRVDGDVLPLLVEPPLARPAAMVGRVEPR